MAKHLLSLAAAIFFCNTLYAQSEGIEAGEGQVWWANYELDSNTKFIDGTSIAEHYDAAVFIPQGLATEGSATIDGFSFFPITEAADNVTVWVAPTLTDNSGQWLETVTVPTERLKKNKFCDVAFTKQHAIPAGGLYVGVSFDITDFSDSGALTPLCFTSTEANRKNSFFYKTTSKRAWSAIDGNAYVKILFGGGQFAKNAVSVKDFATSYVVKDQSVSIPMELRNMGTNNVETITYTITTGGVASAETTKAVSIKGFQNSLTTTIDFPADEVTKVSEKVLTITKVNGQPNECENRVSRGKLVTLQEHYQAVPVVEAFMGTGYSTSPVAIVGLEKMKETFGDQVVLIAVHYDDVMAIEGYQPLRYSVSGISTSFLNRQYEVYPSPYFLKKDIARELNRTVPAKISLTAMWDGYMENATEIVLKSETTFSYDDDNADYGVAYVILADGLKGSGSQWEQSNTFSGKSGYGEDMNYWYSAPEKVGGMTYDNVPIAAKEIVGGMKLLDGTSIKAGQTVSHRMNMRMVGNKLVQDKRKLTAVALLIDRSNNQIVNADKVRLDGEDTGIENSIIDEADNTVNARYDLSGRMIEKVQKGLNIIRMNNGKSLKVIR